MVRINNGAIIRRLINEAKINTSVENVPQSLADKILPVINVNESPEITIIETITKPTTGDTTIYTTPTDRDFYLSTIFLSGQADVTADNTTYTITGTPADSTGAKNILRLNKLTLTVFSEVMQISFPIPIKLKRGSTLIAGSTFSVGASHMGAGITGFVK